MGGLILILVALAVQIALAVKFSEIAEGKGYNGLSYGWICFFLGVVGYCLVIALPDLQMQQTLRKMADKINQLETQMSHEQDATTADTPSHPTANQKPTVSEEALTPISSAGNEVVCPICNTKQQSGRKVCWSCGQKFISENL